MADNKTITVDAAGLEALIEAKLAARLAEAKGAPTPKVNEDLEDGFARAQKLHEKAAILARTHHWRAFRSPRGAVGVAYVTQSKTHDTGRVQKFDAYVLPPEEQRAKFEGDKFDRHNEPTPKYKAWIWAEYGVLDTREFVGAEGSALPDAGPPRATLADAEQDLTDRLSRRDAAFADREQRHDPMLPHALKPLPATVPVAEAK